MGLLEELLIRIGIDISGEDRIDQARNGANDLTRSLGDTERMAGVAGASFVGFAARAVGALTAALSVGNAISGAISRAEMIGELSRTSEALNIAVEDLDAFGKAAERAGGDAQGARDTLTDMAEKIGEAFSDSESGAAKAFAAIGVSVTDGSGKAKDAMSGFLDLAEAVEGLDRSAAVFKIKELGITDNRSVEMILKGRKELERMLAVQKAQGVVTKEVAERAKALNEGLAALRGATSSAANTFLDALIPTLTKVVNWLTKVVDWAGEHKDVIVGFFIAVGAIVTAVYLPAMIAAAAATLAATWPLILIGALLVGVAAAFALAYEDVMNFIDGNDSLIGQIFDKYPMVEKIVMTLIEVFKAFWDTLMTGAAQIGGFVTAAFLQVVQGIKFAVDYLGEAYGSFQKFSADVMAVFDSIGATVKAVFASIVETIKTSIAFVMDSINKVKSVGNSIAGFVGLGDDDTEQAPQRREARPSGSGQSSEDVPRDVESPRQDSSVTPRQTEYNSLVPQQSARAEAAEPEARVSPRMPVRDSEVPKVAAERFPGPMPAQLRQDARPEPAPAPPIPQTMQVANQQIKAASASPMNSVTSNAITNSTQTRNSTVEIGQVTVNTQATDAEGVSRDIGSELGSQLKNLEHESATGVAR